MAPTNGSPALPADPATIIDAEARYASRVLRAFIRDGCLTSIPAREKKRRIVIRFLCDQCFTEDRPYPEAEVNQRLALWHRDVAALRRFMIEARLMTRDGGIYRLTDPPPPFV